LRKYRLLELDGSADSLELSLEGLGVFLGNAFLDLGGNAFDHSLCLGEAETGDAADFLDDLDLLSTEAGHDNVKLGLLFDDGAGSDSGTGGDGSGGDTEGVLQGVDELAELKNGRPLISSIMAAIFSLMIISSIKNLCDADYSAAGASTEPPFCSRI
jgi:hypothetical protein